MGPGIVPTRRSRERRLACRERYTANTGPRDDLLDPTPLCSWDGAGGRTPSGSSAAGPVLALAATDDVLLVEEENRRTMRGSLQEIARASSGGEIEALRFPWWRLTSTHTALIRAHPAGR